MTRAHGSFAYARNNASLTVHSHGQLIRPCQTYSQRTRSCLFNAPLHVSYFIHTTSPFSDTVNDTSVTNIRPHRLNVTTHNDISCLILATTASQLCRQYPTNRHLICLRQTIFCLAEEPSPFMHLQARYRHEVE